MPTIGVHAFVLNGDWNNDIAPETIRLSAEMGFDLLEIPLLRPAELDTTGIRKLLQAYEIRPVTSLALPEDKHKQQTDSGQSDGRCPYGVMQCLFHFIRGQCRFTGNPDFQAGILFC